MKFKRKQSACGVKPSTCNDDSKSTAKLNAANSDINNKSESISDKHCEKKDKMPINALNGTSSGPSNSHINGSAFVDANAKSSVVNRNFPLKEKRKSINHEEFKNQSGLSNQEISNGNHKSQLINFPTKINEKESKVLPTDKSSHLNSLPADKTNLSNGNNLGAPIDSTNNSSNVSCNGDLWSKKDNSNLLNSKRDLESEPANSKKLKTDKCDESKSAPIVATASTMTEPDCLGFAEPGTSVVLEGAVLDEIEGVLVVNVTWRGKTYVGTLLDCTKHDWASPRFCDSPSSSDLDSRGPSRFRSGKRSRGSISENENNIKLQQSKLRNGKGRRIASGAREEQQDQQHSTAYNSSNFKRSNNSRSDSVVKQHSISSSDKNNNQTSVTNNLANQTKNQQSSPVLIRCPEPTCNKRYRHINGLKYHQAHHPHHEISNSTKPLNSSANKTGDQSESNKESEETTDAEEYLDKKETASNTLHSTNNKLGVKHGKPNKEERNKSPFSDISDDTENESRPSSNNSENASPPTNLSAKKEEIDAVNSMHNSSANDHGNLKPAISKDDQKTNEELRKLASEVDLKLSNAALQASFPDKSPLNASANSAPSNALLTNPSLTKPNCSSLFSQNFTMEPALHAFLMQTDLSYRLNYERYLMENQEKFLSQLTPTESNSLSDLEKERYKPCFLTQSPTAFNGFNNFISVGKDSVFKLPNSHLPTANATSASSTNLNSPNRSLNKLNEKPALASSTTSASGGSIVNGTSNQSQGKNTPSPYDFMEYEKQMEKQREEMFRLSNSFKMEEQRLLNSKAPFASSNTKIKDSAQIENQLNGSNNKMIRSHEETALLHSTKGSNSFLSFTAPNLPTNLSTTNQSFAIPNAVLSNFSSPKASVHPLSFDPAFFNRSGHFSPSLLNGTQQSAFINPLDSFRFSNMGLSPIDLNSANNSSKLITAAGQQAAHLLSNNKIQTNGLLRTQSSPLNPSLPSTLNVSNNGESKDENRSPPLRNHPQVGVGFQTIMDPYGGKL